MMKKLITLILSVLLLVGIFAGTMTASAKQYTKQDIVDVVSTSPIYKYISGDVKNLARALDATDDQLNELYGIATRFAALKLDAKKWSAHKFSTAEINQVLALIDEACDVLDLHYTFVPSNDPKHTGDIVFKVYDANNKLIYSFDGDVVKKTGADQTALFAIMSVLGGLLLAGAVVLTTKARKARV